MRTVRYAHSILHCALEDAIRGDLLIVNAATRAAPPRRDRASVRARKAIWNAEQLGCFLESVRGTEFGLAYHLAAATGMRRGEVLGLRWPDVVGGFDELIVRTALVRVNGEYELKPPKSRRPRRLRIDAVTAGMLERHLDVVGSSGGEWNLVFAGPDLQRLVPDHMTVDFARQVARTSLPRVRLHNLRHTHATILLEAGVPVTEVSARLGHVDPRIGPQSVRHIAVRALSPLPPLP